MDDTLNDGYVETCFRPSNIVRWIFGLIFVAWGICKPLVWPDVPIEGRVILGNKKIFFFSKKNF